MTATYLVKKKKKKCIVLPPLSYMREEELRKGEAGAEMRVGSGAEAILILSGVSNGPNKKNLNSRGPPPAYKLGEIERF